MTNLSGTLFKLHEDACVQGLPFYKDPGTGAHVFTRLFHLSRGSCCGNACRHCPFDYENVPSDICAEAQIRRSRNL